MLLAFALAIATPAPVDLDRLSIDHARRLHGRPVVASFLVAKPTHTDRGRTTAGAADQPDGAERLAILPVGRDPEQGRRVTVAGVLRVTDWTATFVCGVLVPGWVSIEVRCQP